MCKTEAFPTELQLNMAHCVSEDFQGAPNIHARVTIHSLEDAIREIA